MAYKFQSGLAQLGGTISTSGELHVSGSDPKFADNSIEVADLDVSNGSELAATPADGDLIMIADVDDSNAVKKIAMSQLATYLSGADPTFAQVSGALGEADTVVAFGTQSLDSILNITASQSITAGSELVIGSAAINEAELETIDGVTAGTVAASKAVVVDSNLDAAGFRTLSGSGNVTFLGTGDFGGAIESKNAITAGTSFIIGSADLNETDLEKLDGITNGAGAANKALVLDANADIASGLRSVTGSGDLYFANGRFSGDVSITGDLLIEGQINKVVTNTSELEVEDIRILVGSGSNQSALDGGGIFFGGGIADDDVSAPHWAALAYANNGANPDSLDISFSGSNVMKVDASGEVSLLEDGSALKLGADGDVLLTHVPDVGLLLAGGSPDSGPALQFRDSALSISSSVDGFLDISADSGLNLSASYVGVLGSLTSSGGVKAVDLESSGYMKVHYDSMGYVDGNTVATATNTNGLLAFVSGTALSPRTTQLSGAILAGDMPSFVSVTLTSSQADTAVFLSLPAFGSGMGSGDVGKKLTIKRTGASSDTVDLVLTGNVANDAGLFEGSLNELTMSSPGAAVNLMWNGAYYEIY